MTGETGVHPHSPQGYHAHALLARGAEVLELLFPGLRDELSGHGAPVYDYGERISFLLPDGFAPRHPAGVLIQSFTRDLLERTLRRRVLSLPQVRSVTPVRCEALLPGPGGRVGGVRCRDLGDESETELEADLVVDASGRAGGFEDRLRAFGVRAPAPLTVDVRITYTTVGIPRPEDPGFDIAYQMTMAPDRPTGGVILAVEHERWICSLVGYGEQGPPRDSAGYLGFAGSLSTPDLAGLLAKNLGEDGPVHRYTNVNSRWHQYHRARNWPERLLAVGDSVCVFNPVYGQGLTVAALEADLLRRELAGRRRSAGGLDGLGRDYQGRVARLLRAPWALSSNSDLMWDGQDPSLATRIAHGYNRRLLAAAVHDPAVWTAFVRVVNMVASPATLFHPSVLARVLRRSGGRAQEPGR
ncbi:monooxygenase [Streptacidiphilus sp. 4-A2]|nr:monooxygenase [Streptacidiphilus sp. 4-A2]